MTYNPDVKKEFILASGMYVMLEWSKINILEGQRDRQLKGKLSDMAHYANIHADTLIEIITKYKGFSSSKEERYWTFYKFHSKNKKRAKQCIEELNSLLVAIKLEHGCHPDYLSYENYKYVPNISMNGERL